jgi:hypothetical protein
MEHPFAKYIVDTIYLIGEKTPGTDIDFIKKLSSINGKEKYLPHYEQLMQILSEILIIKKAITFNWNNLQSFDYEPTSSNSKKNPELNIFTKEYIIGIEVKSPELLLFSKKRNNNLVQLCTRILSKNTFPENETTLPRDNPIKDFLISADNKFRSFKEVNKNYLSILYIVWDDFINEPISALIGKPGELLESESFAKDSKGENLRFENVDFIMISRHRYQFCCFAGEKPVIDDVPDALDYGRKDIFPFKIIIQNPYSKNEPTKEILECFQVYTPSPLLGSEYNPTDVIWYFGT